MEIKADLNNETLNNRLKRVVIKVGSSTVSDEQGLVDSQFVDSLARQASTLVKTGSQVAIVCSGSMIVGRSITGDAEGSIIEDQASASFGQAAVTTELVTAFRRYGVNAGQLLLLDEHLEEGIKTVDEATKKGVIILNRNDAANLYKNNLRDTTANNDSLAVHVAKEWDAQALIILTDVDGVLDESGEALSHVTRVEEIEDIITKGGKGHGGMWLKALSAERGAKTGRLVVIANGQTDDVLLKIVRGEGVGTRFIPRYML